MDSGDSSSSEMEVEYETGKDGDRAIKTRYTIITEERIRQLQDDLISGVSSLVCVSRGQACTLLLQTNWDLDILLSKWFTDEERIRKSIGLSAEQEYSVLNSRCKMCYQEIEIENLLRAPCGHRPFCRDCWRGYISALINNDGTGCLNLGCPETGCKAIVGLDMVELLSSDYDKDIYYRYLLLSYVEVSCDLKCCPAPGCRLVVHRAPGYCRNLDVTCACSHAFCWECLKENHYPIDCEFSYKWCKDNASEAEDIAWLVSNIKTCPRCLRNTGKNNHASNHMTCGPPCRFEFCWLCLDPWTSSHKCNNYKEESLEEKYLKAHVHYYERWDSNHKSMEAARAKLSRARKVADNWDWTRNSLTNHEWMVVIEALERIVECRSILKWSYAYGYYLYLNNARNTEFIVFLQAEAEGAVERLHHFVETEMERCLESDGPENDLGNFVLNLKNLKDATSKYLENLIGAVDRRNWEMVSV